MKNLKNHTIILLCFAISLTERFTQASIPLIVNHLGLTHIEMSLFLSALAASTVFSSLVVAPYIDTSSQQNFLVLICFLALIAGLSFFMFDLNETLGWGCLLMFCVGATLRIINLRRLSVINTEVHEGELSRAHTRMQLSITIAMAAAPICLALTAPDNYLNFTVALLLTCIVISFCTASVCSTSKTSNLVAVERRNSKELIYANFFIFFGMLLSGVFLSILLIYCQSVSEQPVKLYAKVMLSQVFGLIAANALFERFFGERFKGYSFLITAIAVSELAFIFTKSELLINALSCIIGFSFQIMFLRSHNLFQRKIPYGLSAKLNGVRGLYTFTGATAGYLFGPVLYNFGGVELVLLTCSVIALFFFLFLRHLHPSD